MWWTMMAMIRCQDYLDTLNKPIAPRLRTHLGYHMTIQCHDELVFDFPKGSGSKPWKTNLPKIRRIQGIMERCGTDIGVPRLWELNSTVRAGLKELPYDYVQVSI
jgi:hypothetical protein